MTAAAALLLSVTAFGGERQVPDELIVGFKAGVKPGQAEALYMQHGGARLEELPQLNVHKIRVPAHSIDAVEEALRRRPEVEFVERNLLVEPQMATNDPYYTKAWHLAQISAPAAWDVTQGTGIVIAMVDTGVDPTHPDLVGNLVPGYNTYSNNSNTSDVNGHGTGTAGIAGAVGNNSLGVTGVSWRSRIMPMRASDASGMFQMYDIAEAVTWAVDHGARIINMSLRAHQSATVSQAAQYAIGKGAVVVNSAGNCGCWDSTPENPYMVTVAATVQDDVIASLSASGNFVDLSAPMYNYTTTRGGGYAMMGGTSAAAPVVSGVAALMMAANPYLKPADIVALLKANADDRGPSGWDPQYGAGRVNAYRAVAAAVAKAVPAPSTDTTNPVASISSPSSGATVSGTVNVSASASDNVGVSKVELYVDGQLSGSDSLSPFSIAWDTSKVGDGQHTLVARAYDAAGNVGASGSVTVSVSNGSATDGGGTGTTTDTTSPTTNVDAVWQVGRKLKATVSASDNVGVVKVQLYVDGTLKATSSTAPVTFNIDLRQLSAGTHTLVSKAYDAAGNVGASKSVTFAK